MQNDFRIVVFPTAQKDLDLIFDYIYTDLANPTAARKAIDLLYSSINNLTSLPYIFPVLKNKYVQDDNIRKMVVKQFIVIYKVCEKEIWILRVFHSKTNYLNE